MGEALQILPGLYAAPCRYLWHPATRTAVLSDLHLGIETSLARQGIDLPDVSTPLLRQRWEELLARRPARIIIAGDLFDAPAPGAPARELCRSLLAAAACPITIIPGNHDPDGDALARMFADLPVNVEPFVLLQDMLISHGHDLTLAQAAARGGDVWIVGHQHPAVTLSTRVQHAKMPCFVVCRMEAATTPRHVVVLPAFSPVSLGSNLLAQLLWLLPIPRPPHERIEIFGIIEPAGREPQVLAFGPLSMHA
jgi:putative SbcD/Mre11-related phosphoesterase